MQSLEVLRSELDQIDKEIVELYERRIRICEQVAVYKQQNGRPILDPEREAEKLRTVAAMVTETGDQKGIQEVFQLLMRISRERQQEWMEQKCSRPKESFFVE